MNDMKKIYLFSPVIFLIISIPFTSDIDIEKVNNTKINFKFTLNEIASYGARSLDNNSKLPAGGSTFGNISDIEVTEDNKLLVLDNEFRKIVVFKDNGEIERVILGGFGRGPGEFQLPTALTIGPQKQIIVYDYNLRQLTYFSAAGEYLTSEHVRVPSKNILYHDGSIWIAILSSRGSFVSHKLINDDKLNYELAVSEDDLNYSPRGSVGWLGISKSKNILVAATRPGIWYKREDGEFKKYGKLLVRSSGKVYKGMWVNPGANRSIDAIGENYIALVWSKRDMNDPLEIESFLLEIFKIDGKHIGTIKLPFKWISAFSTSKDGRHVYIATNEPFPRVVRYEFIEE